MRPGSSLDRIGSELSQALQDFDRADAIKLGILTSELSALEFIANLADASIEDLHNGLKFLARAAESSPEAFATLRDSKSGTFRENSGRNANCSTRSQTGSPRCPMGSARQRWRSASLAGRDSNLIPMLNGGAECPRLMPDEARTLGPGVPPEVAAGASALNDNFTGLRTAAGTAEPVLVRIPCRPLRLG